MQLSPETKIFIREHQNDDIRTLALQAKRYPGVDMSVAINQIAGRKVAEHKIPSWHANEDILYPIHLSLEQCSSEITARYKASLVKGNTLADLTGGFGIDCAFMSTRFQSVTYIEQQEELCKIAAHNFPVLGLNHIIVKHQNAVQTLNEIDSVDCLFIDPARRNEHGGKTVLVSDCEPDVETLQNDFLQKAKLVMIKLSPMLDLSLALRSLPHTREVHIISVHNECKELLLIMKPAPADTPPAEIPIHCINFTHSGEQIFCFTQTEEVSTIVHYTNEVGKYLYEPNASELKAGAFRSIAEKYNLKKLHPNSHLYTSDNRVDNFPGRTFHVETHSFNLKEITSGIKKANITVRNFPVTVAELRKRTKLVDGGDIYLFATTLNNGKKVYIRTLKINESER